MKNIKRILALVIVATMLVAIAIIPASAAVVPDDPNSVRRCTHGGLEYIDTKRFYYYADYCEDCGAVYDMSSNYVVRWYCGYNEWLYTN